MKYKTFTFKVKADDTKTLHTLGELRDCVNDGCSLWNTGGGEEFADGSAVKAILVIPEPEGGER